MASLAGPRSRRAAAICLAVSVVALRQDTPAGSWAALQQDASLRQLEALLAEPAEAETVWRADLFRVLSRLEHAPVARVLPGWEALATSHSEGDLANLILYRRRHVLPLAPEDPAEGAECALERALAHWGERRFSASEAAFEAAAARFPADARLAENLHWLQGRVPAALAADAAPRAVALSVLSSRWP